MTINQGNKRKHRAKRIETNNATINFDPRGSKAKPFVSKAKSKKKEYCGITDDVVYHLAHDKEMGEKLIEDMGSRGSKSKCQVLKDYLPEDFLGEWRITKFLGYGSSGTVFSTRGPHNQRGALKIVREKLSDVKKEMKMQKKFHKLGLGPDIIKFDSFKSKSRKTIHLIHMERIDGTIGSYLKSPVGKKQLKKLMERFFRIIKIMVDNKLTHGDLHSENIGFVYSRGEKAGKIQVIDYGISRDKYVNPELTLIQFLRVNHRLIQPEMNSDNRKFVNKYLREKAFKIYGIRFPRSLDDITYRMIDLREKMYAGI